MNDRDKRYYCLTSDLYHVMCSNFRRLKVRLGYCSKAEKVEALLIIRRNG